MRRVAYPSWIWKRLTTKSLRKKTKQTLRFYCMVTAKAKLRLVDFQKTHNEARHQTIAPLFSEAVELFKTELAADTSMKPRNKGYRLDCITKLQKTWPELWESWPGRD